MTQSDNQKCYPFDRSGIYCIRVHGSISESWSERLAGMRISTENPDGQGPVTTLVGSVPDQAALSGVLETLYERHHTLLSVELLEEGE
jgi:hypothetical protein